MLVLKFQDFGENLNLLKPDIPVLYGYRRLPPMSAWPGYVWTILERWARRESNSKKSNSSPSQRAPVGDTVKRGGGGGKVIPNKRRAKNDVEPRVRWTLNTAHQFIIIDHLHQDT